MGSEANCEIDIYYVARRGGLDAELIILVQIEDAYAVEQEILNSNQTYKKVDFPQIAYGVNSLYRGMKSFADITKSNIYKENAEAIFGWFIGQNMAQIPMYDTKTGRCYDGINRDLSVNLNSGAESTIECLLAILKRGKI